MIRTAASSASLSKHPLSPQHRSRDFRVLQRSSALAVGLSPALSLPGLAAAGGAPLLPVPRNSGAQCKICLIFIFD